MATHRGMIGISKLPRDGVVPEPSSNVKTSLFLGLWNMGRKCYRIPARARTMNKGAARWYADKYFTTSPLEKN